MATRSLPAVVTFSWLTLAALVGLALLPTGAVWGQAEQEGVDERPAAEQPADAGGGGALAIFRQAYAASQAAATEEDFTGIIETIEDGLAMPASQTAQDYGRRLLAWVYNRRGELRAESGNEEGALADFERSVEHDPTRWNALHNRGVSYGMAGRYDEALADFNRVIELNPRLAKAWYNRGEVRFKQRDLDGAISDYSRAIQLNPRDAAAYNSRGFAYYSRGDSASAVRDLTTAIQLAPDLAEAYVNRGDIRAEQGQVAAAISDYQAALRADPNFGRAYQSSAWVRATTPIPQFRMPELAVRNAQRAIELDGEDYRYLDTLAAAQASAGQFVEAQATAAKAIEIARAEGAPEAEVARMQQRLDLYAGGQPYRDLQPGIRQFSGRFR